MTPRKLLLVALVTALLPTAAQARPRPGGQLGGRSFEANKTFGLGLELGSPTGLTGKLFLSESGALDFGVGSIFGNSRSGAIHIYGDYLFHPLSLVSHEAFELPLYVGIGGRFWHFDERFDPPFDVRVSATVFGVRVPVGVAFDFNSVPLDVFIQIVPTLDFYSYNNNVNGAGTFADDGFQIDFDASIGVRYWFN